MIFRLPIRLICCGLFISLSSCEWGDANVGANLINNTNAAQQQVIDTFTVKVSTVLLDSIATSATTQLTTGQYTDPYLGVVRASNFCQIALTESFRPSDEAVFDSLTLSLRYNYHYGDTTQLQQVTVYALTDRLDETRTYYNTSTIAYGSSLGSRTFRARPTTGKRLDIRLSDALGRQLFQEARQGNLSGKEDWLSLLKGIALVPGSADNAAILGFIADSTQVNFYYHTPGVNEIIESVQTVKADYWFNQIKSDRSRTSLAALQQIRQSVASATTNQEVYIQGGVGIGIRIDFPTLQLLKNIPNGGVNSAILTLKPIPNTVTKKLSLPSPLAIYTCDEQNRLVNYLLPSFSSSGQLTAGYSTDPGTNEHTYKFDLTEYVSTIVRSTSTQWNGLMILPLQHEKDLSRAVLGGNKHAQYALKLDVYYAVFSAY
jgi:hypothetical protein